jgi:N-methylhydantoinase A/oxoprolinase/acetone carboxylase beta subunit
MVNAPRPSDEAALVGVDVGGTFTDAVVVHRGRVTAVKRPSTPHDQSEGVMAAVRACLDQAGVDAAAVERFAHGMTVGTNALLEGTGARTALVATRGFGDVLELRRQNRAHLYRLGAAHPDPLVPHDRVVEAAERCVPDGVLTALTDDECARVAEAIAETGASAVAVGLLFSFAHPAHEQKLARAIAARCPDVHVSISSDVLAEFREYERISTTTVDAYLTPVVGAYLAQLSKRARGEALPAPAIMLSNGGVLDIDKAARHAAWTVLSGPAGGALGAAFLAGLAGEPDVLTFDMGGTSCDVALIQGGVPGRSAATTVAGHPIHLPMLDVQTVSAGGGSIAWVDSGGALRVGPQSAGARPGPAAYGHGGRLPTVTDANVVLGRLPLDRELGGTVRLHPEAAAEAVGAVAAELGISVQRCAEGVIEVAVQEMVRALRVVSVERGVDPRQTCLMAFGGAGPLHACDVADELGIKKVLAPAAAGVLAALGLVVAGERRDYVRSVLRPVSDDSDLPGCLAPLLRTSQGDIAGAELTTGVDCRYQGQTHALAVEWDPEAPAAALAASFHAAHRARYGDADESRPVEAVTIRLTAQRGGAQPALSAAADHEPVAGLTTIAMDGATCHVAPGWTARRDPLGTIVMERS